MQHLRRPWLAGALVLVVAGVAAAPAHAQPGNLWELRCLSLGGTFSIKGLGGQAVEYECSRLGSQDANLADICRRFPDFRSQGATVNIHSGGATMRCMRSGVANVDVRVGSQALFSDPQHIVVFVDYKCDPAWYPRATLLVDTGATGTARVEVTCSDDWRQSLVSVTGGPFGIGGRSEVTVSGLIQGQLGDSDTRDLRIVF